MSCYSYGPMLPVPWRQWRCLHVFRDDLQTNYCFPMLHSQNPMYSYCSRQTPPDLTVTRANTSVIISL
jgi:hypothetical protein